jgi:hypothetical protein
VLPAGSGCGLADVVLVFRGWSKGDKKNDQESKGANENILGVL